MKTPARFLAAALATAFVLGCGSDPEPPATPGAAGGTAGVEKAAHRFSPFLA